jgi:hypothetical protein
MVAKATAATVPTAYSAVLIPASDPNCCIRCEIRPIALRNLPMREPPCKERPIWDTGSILTRIEVCIRSEARLGTIVRPVDNRAR